MPLGLPDAQVTLTGNGQQRTVTAANDGSFRFDRLAPGKYRVSASKSSFSNDYANNELDLHAGGCAYALETLAIDRRISGLIVGSNGLPAPGIQIELVPARPTEFNSLPFPVAETKTDAAGRYELRNLRPGSYYLGINLARTPSPEMPYTRYFFPGVEDPASAAIINVESAPGDHSYDLHIPPPQNQRTVEGNVYWPDGRPAPKVDILLEDPRWPWQTSTIVAATGDNGHFAIPVFDGTAYRVHAVTRAGFIYDAVSAEPQPLVPPVDFNHPLRLVLTKKGHSAAQQIGKGLERWRAGLGL